MKSNTWRETTLGELADFINGDRGKNYPGVADRVDVGIPFINTGHILPSGRLTQDDMDYITSEKYNQLGSGKVRPGDIVYCLRGSTIGKTARNHYEEGAIASSLVIVRAKPKVNQDYLYYFLTSPAGQQLAKSNDNGSAQPNLSAKTLSRYPLLVPNVEEQESIVNTLNAIDNKIEVNTKLNQTLEQMAQATFKSWFVDFDPVKAKMNGEQPEGMDAATASLFPEKLVESKLGLIPEGWEETPLYDIAEYINGAAYKKFEPNGEGLGLPIIKIAELKAGVTSKTGFSTVDMPQKYKLDDTDILFSWSGNPDTSIDTFVWALGEAWLNQHIFKVVPKSDLSRDYVLCLLKYMRPVFAEIARDKQTTGLGHVTVKDLKRLTVAVPSEELLIKFNEKVSAIIAHNFSLVKENQTLEKLRDTLLPKLLSGEIELDVAEVNLND
ncbi:restriction endonuclease subunit S [Vibrio lentus]|uniref:restriction endonuclease subunit S n=1 Tax=Vibrio lentus TaxID=136468 RepID=UPI000C851E19|nr:restriction endonuclease subunit S [Vibrio lentus]MCB5460136.1 restriction endonuclease subunit S [Vibrio lentus]MCC4852532.1 restriction endonuclease subunit S [Vibrio lentus]MCC5493243.1 restriction endonuclease subunit S [Vibrio lentus]MCC5530514.1 restriction endonuclease subunit S [Vibrio lentus]MCC5537044.1 restriction endonuclease subunit S [Vibrio lentus]